MENVSLSILSVKMMINVPLILVTVKKVAYLNLFLPIIAMTKANVPPKNAIRIKVAFMRL
jgi:hypothetical protein